MPPPSDASTPSTRRRRWPWLLAALLLLFWFLPVVAAKTALLDWLLARLLGPVNGQLVVGSASLGWFSPIVLEDVELRDGAGNAVVKIERIETGNTLWHFLWNRRDLGAMHLHKLSAELGAEKGTSNLERILEPLLDSLRKAPSGSDPGPSLTIDIPDATLALADDATGQRHVLEAVAASIALNGKPDLPFELRLQWASNQRGLDLNLTWTQAGASSSWSLKAQGKDFRLESINPVLRRFELGFFLGGALTGPLTMAWHSGAADAPLVIEGDVTLANAMLAADWLPERLQLANARLAGRFAQQGTRLDFDKAEVASELGTARFSGSIDVKEQPLAWFRRPGLALQGEIDLARLARTLPVTLKLHKDLEVDKGRVSVNAESRLRGKGVAWAASATVQDITGKRAGRTVAWPDPLHCTLLAHDDEAGWLVVDRLDCQAAFLKVKGQGTADRFELQGTADLGRLGALLGEFVDLGQVKLRGDVVFNGGLRTQGAGERRASAEVKVKNWQLEWPGLKPWREDNAVARIDVSAGWEKTKLTLNAGLATIEGGADRAEARLLPSLDTIAATRWDVTLTGDLERWQRRVEVASGPWASWRLSGQGEARTQVVMRAGEVALHALQFQAKNLGLTGPGLTLQETTFTLSGDAVVAPKQLASPKLQVRCPSVNADAADVLLHWGDRLEVAGGLSVAGDLTRLQRWLADRPKSLNLAGTAFGQVGFRWRDRKLALESNLTLQNLVVGGPQAALTDPNMTMRLKGVWDAAADRCQLDALTLESQLLGCAASGKIEQLSSAALVALRGRLSYDLKKLAPALRPYLGKDVSLEGSGQRDFFLEGPLGSARLVVAKKDDPLLALRGEAGLHWTKLSVFHCDIGPTELKARLENGSLKLTPIDTTLNTGRLRLDAALRLSPGPAEVIAAKLLLIDHARMTPAMCNDALGYALPALAGVTEAEGLLSFHLEHARIPLADPTKADVKGTLVLHDAHVGPTPLLRELSALIKAPASVSIRKEARVPVHLVDGKVHHRDLELIFPDLTVRTSGWVGLDGNLALVAEMPIPGSWVGSDRIGKAVEGRTLRLPIQGTLERPRLDPKAVQAAFAQFVRDSAGAAVRNEIEERLKKLLRPK